MPAREPMVTPIAISDLRPTQMTVGFREVAEKRKLWRERASGKGAKFLGSHMIPVIAGPKDRLYVTDHHHLSRALQDEGVRDVLVDVVADLSKVDKESFWIVMDCRGWCHPYDSDGIRRTFDDIPPSIADLKDDPYRSLAGELRRTGGYAKDITPFSEFIWADFLRRNIKKKAIEKDFNDALATALKLAKSEDAGYLPGWCGAVATVG